MKKRNMEMNSKWWMGKMNMVRAKTNMSRDSTILNPSRSPTVSIIKFKLIQRGCAHFNKTSCRTTIVNSSCRIRVGRQICNKKSKKMSLSSKSPLAIERISTTRLEITGMALGTFRDVVPSTYRTKSVTVTCLKSSQTLWLRPLACSAMC